MLEEVFRDEWGRVLASLVGYLHDFDKAEEAAQEAFAIAAERWPASGTPPNGKNALRTPCTLASRSTARATVSTPSRKPGALRTLITA